MSKLKFLHSGSTMLNLALTGHPLLGWALGRISNIVGDKSTGKTLLAIEAATLFLNRPPKGIKRPRVKYCEGEAAFDEDYAQMLGMPVDRVEFEKTETVEEVFEQLNQVCNETHKEDQATLFIVDSLDSISSKAEMDREFDEDTYSGEKQKKLGELFRKQVKNMEESQVHLMIISQIRENISRLPFAPKYRRSGGKALDFYASHVVWLAEVDKHLRKGWVYGIQVKANVTKNKVSRPYRQVEFPIIFEYGVDDVYAMLTFLDDKRMDDDIRVEKQKGGWWNWPGVDKRYHLEDLVYAIESEPDLYKQLVQNAYRGWDMYEELCSVDRVDKSHLLGDISEDDVRLDDDETH